MMGSAVVGALGSGQLADWIGRKPVIMIALAISFVAITVEFIATSNPVFFAGKFINGFAVGALASVPVTYIGEVCFIPRVLLGGLLLMELQVTPLAMRGLFTCLSALAYTLGPLVVALIVNSTGNVPSRWAYRAVFCSQYGFAAVSAIFIWFMPE